LDDLSSITRVKEDTMAHASTSAPTAVWSKLGKAKLAIKTLAWIGIVGIALAFVWKYVFAYYLHYNAASFDPYWTRRVWLLLHISGGTLALLMGPWQFWTGLRNQHFQVHRWTGRLFLLGVAIGVIGSIGLAFSTTYGWGFEVGLMGLACAWTITTGMAYYTIRKGLVQFHKEWMIRAYVVTFAFVTFRILSDYGPTSRLQPENDRSIIITWVCWVVPLGITELIFHLKRIKAALHPH
jgi:uncharacterized membrane protein YozB (DUF420 family)